MGSLDAALEYLERGWSIIPIQSDQRKKPYIQWKEFQTRLPTEAEVEDWFTRHPDANIGLLTGALSGVVVVDCDNEEALNAARSLGWLSPVRVKTRRGVHLYFQHPRDGVWRGPQSGVMSRGEVWPQVPGLDLRADGGYVLLPPSKNYQWIESDDIEEAPLFRDWRPSARVSRGSLTFSFDDLDLSDLAVSLDDHLTEWERTEREIERGGFPHGKIPTGQSNGRNERVMRYVAEQVHAGVFGEELRTLGRAFMDRFFIDRLPEREFEATVASIERLEKTNHPERFDASGNVKKPEPHTRRLILASDAEGLIEQGKGQKFYIAPWLKPASITQIYGFSGSGKSLFMQGAAYALASGATSYGPFDIHRPAKTLYMDFELSPADLGHRLVNLRKAYGDAGDRLQTWTPWLEQKEINLRTRDGLEELGSFIKQVDPDVLIIDTVRSAWPGLSENDAQEWNVVNQLAMRIRNLGIAVVMLHHANKPTQDGGGREAGSSNQLTPLDTQIRLAQVYVDENMAKQNGGIWDGSYPKSIFEQLEDRLTPDWYLSMVLQITYTKIRTPTPHHEPLQWIGWARHVVTGEERTVASMSPRARVIDLIDRGYSPESIAKLTNRPLYVIQEWTGTTPDPTLA